ncbi:lethal(3)malignant brain tumor-like protein 4 isoform X2 [Mastomys coucha]|uniref:lethal(3)malignant brain tumor-like protein 4 isoform X2 n=1 Tax=Mastomys coucha TaxID=35658 RepID=UPI001261C00F|nr:lethal(3)malignant brain tumor-like protein 4 isoform X2 [Mastomys coucha]
MRQLNRKRKLSMESTGHMNRDGRTGQTEEEKKPGEGAVPSSQESSVTTQETWSWEQYLREENAVAAPVELFSKDQSFPEHENGFQVGMRLEGIDARRPSVFCVLSVAEVCGYRLRLHFDGYLSCYDFWTNAGSPDIHPVGWCQKTKHELHVPRDYRKDKFVWMDYLKACRLQNAPKKLFRNRSSNGPVPKEFQVGMKLEAVDRRNPCLMYVATVADIVDDRVRVHFDSCDDSFDYWCDVNSPCIQPVGWCQENRRTLVTPQGYPDPEKFSWTDYLQASQGRAVPAKAFNTIHFDGWDHKYDYWLDADSQDIHPIGWCDVTGHPLEVPYGSKPVKILPGQPVCPTPGCRGIGHIRGPRYAGHHSAFGCPYSDMNLKREAALQDRLREQTQANLELDPSHSKSENPCDLNFNGKCEKTNSQCRLVQQAKCLKIKGKEDIDLDNLFREYSAAQVQQMLHHSLSMASMSAHPFREVPVGREQHCKLLPGVAGIQAGQVARWTVDEVAEFVQSLLGCEEHAKCFKKEQIDGKAFLLLTQADIVKVMRIKLGPALKIYNSILMFRNSQGVTEDDVASGQEAKR